VRAHLPLAALTGVAVAFLPGCGGDKGDGDAGARAAKELAGAPTFHCVDQATKQELPATFPSDFPLPPGSVVIGSERRDQGQVIVYAVSPKDVKTTLHSLQHDLPAAGYKLTEGEVERDDAESNWTGNGYRGRWAIRVIDGCGGNTSVTVLAQKH
jgi:hypothetical protein